MRRLVGCFALGLVTVALAAASVAQDNPPGPAFASKWLQEANRLALEFCAEQIAPLPNGNPGVHGLRLNRADNPWLPPLDTPIQQFTSPFGWTWYPDPAHNAWLASSTARTTIDQELCFTHPVTRRITPGEVERVVAEGANGADLYYFTAQQVVPKAKRGELPVHWDLLLQDVTGFYTSPSSACGLVRNFNTGLRISADNNFGKIVQPSTGDTVQGAVNPKTYTFKFVGPTEVYEGGIKGLHLWASYGYTRTFGGGPCTAGYLAHLVLSKPATIAPACRRPTIVAPARVPLRSIPPFRVVIGARCAGKYVSGIRVQARIRLDDGFIRLGYFRTKAAPAQVTLREFSPAAYEKVREAARRSPVKLELKALAQRGLQPATDVADIFFPPRR